MPLKVLVDTNFIFLPLRFGIDVNSELTKIFGQFEIVIPSTVIQELENLKKKNSKTSREVASAKKLLINHKTIKTNLEKGETVDDLIVRTALEHNYIVATADLGLKRRLREQRIPVVYLRQRQKLVLEGAPYRKSLES